MDDHEKALDLLAHKVQDYDEAERYCYINSKVIHSIIIDLIDSYCRGIVDKRDRKYIKYSSIHILDPLTGLMIIVY